MKTENEIETEIKSRIEHIAPSRALFEQTMESVTKMQGHFAWDPANSELTISILYQ